MPPRRLIQALLALGIVCLTLSLLTLRFLAPPARMVDVGAPGDAYSALSFYAPEGAGETTFRWSGPNSAIMLPPHAAGGAFLRLRAHGAVAGQSLVVEAPGSAPAVFTLDGGWRVYQLLAASPQSPHQLALRAELVTPGAADPRELGTAVDWIQWTPLARGSDALAGALGASALLVWGLVLAGVVTWLLWPAARPGVTPRAPAEEGGVWAALGVSAALAGALCFWASRDLDGVTWLLPLTPGPLAFATGMLFVIWALTADERPLIERLRAGLHARLGPAWWVWAGAAAIGLAHLVLWAPLPGSWRGGAALIILWAPGWLAAAMVLDDEQDRTMQVALGIAGALALQIVIALAAAVLPWGASGSTLLGLSDLTSAVLLVTAWRRYSRPAADLTPPRPLQRDNWTRTTLVIVLVAAVVRLPAIGTAELHDDEASVLLAAAELTQGDAQVLLRQLKGPDQVLLPAGPLALSGQLNEQTARLPFAMAGLAVILAALALARGPLGAGRAAAVAGLLLALDGLLIAFARIVQYQSVVMLMGVAAFWCCWRFAQGGPGGARQLLAAAVFTATALLGHYDAVYVTPALALLVGLGAYRRRWSLVEAARGLALPLVVGGALLLGFYVPFALHPNFATTLGHVRDRTGQGDGGWTGYNNLAVSYELLKIYNAPLQLWAPGVLILVALFWMLAQAARGGAGASRAVEDTPPDTRVTSGVVLLWLLVAGGAMSFLIAQPRTHIYVASIPAALLAAVGAGALTRLGRVSGGLLAGAGLLVAAYAGLHQSTVFLRQSPEYIRAYPAAQVAPLPFSGPTLVLDPAARFGFPARDGWKAVGELYRRGELQGAAASNQSSEVLAWYTRGMRRCGAEPAVYLIALSAANPALPAGFVRSGSIQADGRDQLLIYERGPITNPARIYVLDDYLDAFDEQTIPPIPSAERACDK